MERDEDLRLSLSLGSSGDPLQHHQVQLNFTPTSAQWTEQLASSSARGELPVRRMLRGIDVYRVTATERESEEAGTSSPNSTLSSVNGKRGHAVTIGGGIGGDMISDEEDGEGSRKKLRLSKDQSLVLEESFKEHNTLNPKQKQVLSRQLNLRPRQVEVWFQNRRARTKLKQTEVDCEFLKRCCENLTDENGRLQKEVAELRAIKISPQFYMQMAPHTTLTMCPSCERVAPSNKVAVTMPANIDHHYLQHSHNQQRLFTVAGDGMGSAASARIFFP